MRKTILNVAIVLALGVTPAAPAEFYALDGECGLNFTIDSLKGSIAFMAHGWALHLPKKGFVVLNGKLSESATAIFDAILARKGLAVGFYDGTVLPIDLVGFDTKPFVECIAQIDFAR